MLLHRLTNPSKINSFFLFGPRGTGKSTLVAGHLESTTHLSINLLVANERLHLAANPDSLESRITEGIEWVYIDEIQRVPALLDTVHRLIEERKVQFALTGSSARKLKAGGANLLAGRAFVYELYPLTSYELGDAFDLTHTLSWGMLPKLLELKADSDKRDFLEAYALTYLQEEIWEEHLIRNLLPFRKFLQVAAQSNGKIINYSKIAADVRVDVKSVQQYYRILEDTLLGFFLEPHHRSLRKRQRANPKFYLFDVGVWRALTSTYSQGFTTSSLGFGNIFEHFLISEMRALNRSLKKGYEFFFYRKNETFEVDLIIERAGGAPALVEIKSHDYIEDRHVEALAKVADEYPEAEVFCFSCDPQEKKFGRIRALPWKQGIEAIGLAP